MYKLMLTTAAVALFSVTACNSDNQKAAKADTKASDTKSQEAMKTAAADPKSAANPNALPASLETPDELKPEKVEKFGDKEVGDIERVVYNMLKRDPQKFMELVQMAAQFQQAKQELEVRQLLDSNKTRLLSEDNAIIAGNNKGTVTFVLIADPLCPNCRVLEGILGNVMKKQPSLKLIKHQWAFIEGGEPSSFVSRYLQAAYKADKTKFNNLHKAFMMLQEPPSEEKLHALIKGAGFDLEKIKSAAESSEAKAGVEDVRTLAKTLKLPGAPVLMALTPDNQLGIIPVGGNEEQISKIVVELAKVSGSGKKSEEATETKGDAKVETSKNKASAA